jgi:transposase InsO family protein
MSTDGIRIGVGTRVLYDGQLWEVAELLPSIAGAEVVLRAYGRHSEVVRISLREVLEGTRARVYGEGVGPNADDPVDPADVVLSAMTEAEREVIQRRAEHIREVLTGYLSGTAEFAKPGEPRRDFNPANPLTARYAAKAAELGVSMRTVQSWASDYLAFGEAGLARSTVSRQSPTGRVDERWVQTAVEVMVEHGEQSRPSQAMVIKRTNARVIARFGPDVVTLPSRPVAYRVLAQLENRYPLFRLSTKRNRDIASRPGGVYGKLLPTRPGEYLLMDTTRLDVFALDPLTLRWVQAELTVAMDWYTRCITGLRLTPVSTKSVDAAAVLYQTFRPRPAGKDWPTAAVWPEHGIPRSVLLDVDAIHGSMTGASGPAIVPETVVVDHGKIYISDHLTSVCRRMGISIQPARLRTGRDKGPVERFFRTLREDLLQALPGYKGPDVHSRGVDPEGEAFFYLDELEDMIRQWVAAIYHHRPHEGLIDPHVPKLRMSPAQMFEHGIARAGYIEAPRDPDLGYEFLKTGWRRIQHYGVDFDGRRYNGAGLDLYRGLDSPYTGKARGRWPIHYDPDDITRAYFRDPHTRRWHTLIWEHAPALHMALSEDALRFARKKAAEKYRYPDDRLAIEDLLQRWNLGLGTTLAERRMALRLAREESLLDPGHTQDSPAAEPPWTAEEDNSDGADTDQNTEPQTGDDDEDDDGDDDFYVGAFQDA